MAQTLNLPIGDLVPHDPPMILIEAMREADLHTCVCTTTIGPDTLFLEPEGVPALVGVEYMAQTVAAHGGYLAHLANEPVRVGFLLGTPRMVSHVTHFAPGSRLRIEACADWGDSELLRFDCKIFDDGDDTLLQEAGLNVFHPRDLDAYLAQNRG